jgi:hypothetical protein
MPSLPWLPDDVYTDPLLRRLSEKTGHRIPGWEIGKKA